MVRFKIGHFSTHIFVTELFSRNPKKYISVWRRFFLQLPLFKKIEPLKFRHCSSSLSGGPSTYSSSHLVAEVGREELCCLGEWVKPLKSFSVNTLQIWNIGCVMRRGPSFSMGFRLNEECLLFLVCSRGYALFLARHYLTYHSIKLLTKNTPDALYPTSS